MPHYLLFSRDMLLLSLVFQCCMDYNNFIFFSHLTLHLHALWIVPSAQCQFACNKLTNRQTNKSLQQMSESDMDGITNALETAALAGEFKLRALKNNFFYFSKIIIQTTQLCVARCFRWCAIIDNTNYMNYLSDLQIQFFKAQLH